ncbi:MAG: hypothetical protein J6A09_00180 [Alphaproteobacteria bacterium]|nr:hypothetical protein [Alphaproteobacteria bacterium]
MEAVDLMNTMNVAALDLGTNSNRLLIVDKNGNPLYRDVRHVALGDGLNVCGHFSEIAMERAICSFMDFSEMMQAYEVTAYRAIATAACRMSSNTVSFLREVERTSGVKVEVISEYEEARLTLKGAQLNAPKDKKYLFVYDLGGGSTEVTLALNKEHPEIIETVSIPWGARNATEAFSLQNYNEDGAKKLENEVLKYMTAFMAKIKGVDYVGKTALIATSSTPLRLAAWIKNLSKYDKFAADGAKVKIASLENLINKILLLDFEGRAKSVYIGRNRAEIFVAALIIFRTIYRELAVPRLIASLKGAQEAIVSELCSTAI